jgi:hypothetical protein
MPLRGGHFTTLLRSLDVAACLGEERSGDVWVRRHSELTIVPAGVELDPVPRAGDRVSSIHFSVPAGKRERARRRSGRPAAAERYAGSLLEVASPAAAALGPIA